jgi:oligopeptide transport system substrate-binding protein
VIHRSLCLALLTLSLVHCTRRTHLEYGLKLNETVRANLSTEPPTLDWAHSVDTLSNDVGSNLMESLVDVRLSEKGFPVLPSLAARWRISADRRTWTFSLRPGVTWTDGVPFTAQQFLDAVERVLRPQTASPFAYLLDGVHNARAYHLGTLKDFAQVGARVNSKGEIEIQLDQPHEYFLYVIAHHSLYPIRKDLIAKFGEDHWTDPQNLQTLGAFKLKIWDHDRAMVLERNERYFGDKAKIKNILYYMINDYSTALNLYEAGRLDFQGSLPYDELPRLRQWPGFKQVPTLGNYFYTFNFKKPPFDNLKVRKAFVLAVDRLQVTQLLNAGLSPLSGFIPEGLLGFDPKVGLQLDIKAANQLLDEAGYQDRSRFPKVMLAYNSNENHQRIAQNLQAQLKKNLGIEIQLQQEEWKTYLKRVSSDTPNMYRVSWLAEFPDPGAYLSLFKTDSEKNHAGWQSHDYDQWIEQSESEANVEQRRSLYLKAQKLLVEKDVVIMPLFVPSYPHLVAPRLNDFPLNPMDRIQLNQVSISTGE